MASFLHLDASEDKRMKRPQTATSTSGRLASRIVPPSVRQRTLSGFRRVRKLTLTNDDGDATKRAHQKEITLADQEDGATPVTGPISSKAPQVDPLPFESEKHDLLMDSQRFSQKDDSEIWSKWLHVSTNLTPVVGIGSSSSSSASSKRLSKLARQSWRPKTAAMPPSTRSSAWPSRPATAQQLADPANSSIYPKRPRESLEAERPTQDLTTKRESRSFVANPTTGGKVPLRPLTLLTRPGSTELALHLPRDQEKEPLSVPALSVTSSSMHSTTLTMSQPSSPPSTPPTEQYTNRCHKRIKSLQVLLEDQIYSPNMYYSLSIDGCDELYTILERNSESYSLDEQGRPDSPTIPLILDEVNLMKCSQEIMRLVKLEIQGGSIDSTPKLLSKKSWTNRLKQAFSQKRPETAISSA